MLVIEKRVFRGGEAIPCRLDLVGLVGGGGESVVSMLGDESVGEGTGIVGEGETSTTWATPRIGYS